MRYLPFFRNVCIRPCFYLCSWSSLKFKAILISLVYLKWLTTEWTTFSLLWSLSSSFIEHNSLRTSNTFFYNILLTIWSLTIAFWWVSFPKLLHHFFCQFSLSFGSRDCNSSKLFLSNRCHTYPYLYPVQQDLLFQ